MPVLPSCFNLFPTNFSKVTSKHTTNNNHLTSTPTKSRLSATIDPNKRQESNSEATITISTRTLGYQLPHTPVVSPLFPASNSPTPQSSSSKLSTGPPSPGRSPSTPNANRLSISPLFPGPSTQSSPRASNSMTLFPSTTPSPQPSPRATMSAVIQSPLLSTSPTTSPPTQHRKTSPRETKSLSSAISKAAAMKATQPKKQAAAPTASPKEISSATASTDKSKSPDDNKEDPNPVLRRRLTRIDRKPTVIFSGPIHHSGLNLLGNLNEATKAAGIASSESQHTPEQTSTEEGDNLRLKVVLEMINTEKDFINDLALISKLFYIPLKENQIITAKEQSGLFSNITMILGVNSELLKHLELQRKKPVSEARFGSVFVWMSDFFKIYSIYCNNQYHASKLFVQLKENNPRFSQFLQDLHSNQECRGLDLNSFLIKPVQRITKYPLLLKELIKHTPESHTDYQDLQKAYAMLQEILVLINENQRKHENTDKVNEIRRRLVASDKSTVTNTMKFLQSDTVNEAPVRANKRKLVFRKTEYILFDNVLLRAVEKANNKLKVISTVQTDHLIALLDVADDPAHDIKAAFEVSYLSDDWQKSKIVVMASSHHQKKNWLLNFASLKTTRVSNVPSTGSKLIPIVKPSPPTTPTL